jgi:hypothetical protein
MGNLRQLFAPHEKVQGTLQEQKCEMAAMVSNFKLATRLTMTITPVIKSRGSRFSLGYC